MLRSISIRKASITLGALALGVSIQTISRVHAAETTATTTATTTSSTSSTAAIPSNSDTTTALVTGTTDAPPVPVSAYVNDHIAAPENPFEMDVDQIKAFEQNLADKAAISKGIGNGDFARIKNFDPASGDGKIIIKVHKSDHADVREYLEVFKQNSKDPSDLTPLNLFEGGSSNSALVSTAGSFMIAGHMKKFVTPDGTFSLDHLELMHHSLTYNDAPMPYSMFFNEGIAIHAATPNEYPHLGKIASHGCVRTHLDTAKALYQYIESQPDGQRNVVVEVSDQQS